VIELRADIGQVLAYLWVCSVPVVIAAYLLGRHHIRQGTDRRSAIYRTLVDALLAMSLLGIIVVTMVVSQPPAGDGSFVNIVPLRSVWNVLTSSDLRTSTPVRNLLLNVLLFVPSGFLVALRLPQHPLRFACLAGLAVSLLVEATQFALLRGRAVDIDDLILNTLGAVLGGGLALVMFKLFAVRAP